MSQVLVVDDEADIRALISDILSDEGYGVTVAPFSATPRKVVLGYLPKETDPSCAD